MIPHGYACRFIPDRVATGFAETHVPAGATGSAGADVEKQASLDKYATCPSHETTTLGGITTEQIGSILKDQFGMIPRRSSMCYVKPYPSEYDLIPLPPKYRLPEFSKFNGTEGASSIEHVSRYL